MVPYDVEGVNVIILYRKGRVSGLGKTTDYFGKNIIALRVDSTFDDCQQMGIETRHLLIKLMKKIFTSANSVSMWRMAAYYLIARPWKQWKEGKQPGMVFGGNLKYCAGLLAKVTSLPLGHLAAAYNERYCSDYLKTEKLVPKTAQ